MHEEFSGLNDAPPDLWVPMTMHGAVIKQELFGANQPREVAIDRPAAHGSDRSAGRSRPSPP